THGWVVGYDNWRNGLTSRHLGNPHAQWLVFPFNDWSISVHISMLANNETWALVSTYGSKSGTGPFQNEILQASTGGSGQVRRLAHHHANATDWSQQPRANISHDGRYVAFTSNWGTGRKDMYVLQIPPAP